MESSPHISTYTAVCRITPSKRKRIWSKFPNLGDCIKYINEYITHITEWALSKEAIILSVSPRETVIAWNLGAASKCNPVNAVEYCFEYIHNWQKDFPNDDNVPLISITYVENNQDAVWDHNMSLIGPGMEHSLDLHYEAVNQGLRLTVHKGLGQAGLPQTIIDRAHEVDLRIEEATVSVYSVRM